MSAEMAKRLVGILLRILLRIPLTALGGWLLTRKLVSQAEWTLVVEGACLLGISVSWSLFERYGVLKALDQSRLDTHEAKELVQVALALPQGATLEDALVIHQNEKEDK